MFTRLFLARRRTRAGPQDYSVELSRSVHVSSGEDPLNTIYGNVGMLEAIGLVNKQSFSEEFAGCANIEEKRSGEPSRISAHFCDSVT